MKAASLWFLILFAVLAGFIFPKESLSSPYYANKVIRIISGSEPGGNYDRMARLLAKHLPKYIPGKPTIIIENIPGAGSLIAANYLYNLPPDGLAIGAPQRGIPIAQLTKAKGVKYDVMKFEWIGSASVEPMVFAVRASLPIKNINDLRTTKESIFVPGAGPGASDYQFTYLLKEFLGLNIKSITYLSGSAGRLAFQRNEVDAIAGSYSTVKTFIEQGGMVRLLIRSKVSEPGIENLPVDEDNTLDSKGKIIMSMRAATDRIARPYIAPPRTPASVMKILWEAFARVSNDKELREDAKKFNIAVQYIPRDECLKTLKYMFNQPEEIIREFGKYVQF
jgi:tripartite-type tricarboxylate transporter receptor subunit TctC